MKINNILYITLSIGLVLFFVVLIIRYLLFKLNLYSGINTFMYEKDMGIPLNTIPQIDLNKPIIETLNIGAGSLDFSINADGVPVDSKGEPVYDYKTLNKFGDLFSKNISQYVNEKNFNKMIGINDNSYNASALSSNGSQSSMGTLLNGNRNWFDGLPLLNTIVNDVSYVSGFVDPNATVSGLGQDKQNPINTRDSSEKRSQRVYGNDGTVSCQAYCAGGGNGRPWNEELPYEWKGAQCKSVKGIVKNHRVTKEYPTADFSMDCDSSWNSSKIDVDCQCEETGYGWKTTGTDYFYNDGSISCNDFCKKGGGETGQYVPYSWYGAKCIGVINIGNGGDLNCDSTWGNDWNGQTPAPPGTNFGKCICQSTGEGWDDYSHATSEKKPNPNLPDNSEIKCRRGICVGFEPDGKPYCYGNNGGCRWGKNDCSTDEDCRKRYYPGLSSKYTDGKQYSCTNKSEFWNGFMTFNFDHWLNDRKLYPADYNDNWNYWACPSKYAITRTGPETELVRAGRNANRGNGNGGSIPCDKYCQGLNGGPWPGSNVPASWNGAKCVAVESNFRDKGLNCDNGFNVGSNERGSKDGQPLWADCICTNTGGGWRPPVPPRGTIFCGRNNACVGINPNDGYSYIFGGNPWKDNNDGRCDNNSHCAKFNWGSRKHTDRKTCRDADNPMSWWADPCYLPKDWEIHNSFLGRYGESR